MTDSDRNTLITALAVILLACILIFFMLGYAMGVQSMQDKLDRCADGFYATMGALRYALEVMP